MSEELKNNPAWKKLMEMPVIECRTPEEIEDWNKGLEDIKNKRYRTLRKSDIKK